MVFFVFNEVQEKFIVDLWYCNIVLKVCQCGFFIVVQILMLDVCLFVLNIFVVVIVQDDEIVEKIMCKKIEFVYDWLLKFLCEMILFKMDNVWLKEWVNGFNMQVFIFVCGDMLNWFYILEYGIICYEYLDWVEKIIIGVFVVVECGIIVIELMVKG